MKYRLEIFLKGPAHEPHPPNENAKRRMHFFNRSRSANMWKRIVLAQILISQKPEEPLTKAKVTLIRYTTKRRICDGDAIPSACKPIVDGLKIAGIIIDDKWRVIGMPIYDQKECDKESEGIKVIVEEL